MADRLTLLLSAVVNKDANPERARQQCPPSRAVSLNKTAPVNNGGGKILVIDTKKGVLTKKTNSSTI